MEAPYLSISVIPLNVNWLNMPIKSKYPYTR